MSVVSTEEAAMMRECGGTLARIVRELAAMCVPGARPADIDARARELAREAGGAPAFLGYRPAGAREPFPASVCLSVNDEVVHGIPSVARAPLADGDIATVDMGLSYNGWITDMATTVAVGAVDEEARKLITAAKDALGAALRAARPGATTGDIGHAVESLARARGFSTPRELGGHGVGRAVHEDPFIPNFGAKGSGEPLTVGMTLAIEPIVIMGAGDIRLGRDGYTLSTQDGTRAAQFEHTVLITPSGAEVLTI